MRNKFIGAFIAFCSCAGTCDAVAADFVFGDDFDSSIVCPAGPTPAIAGAMSPDSRTTRLGTSNTFLVKVRSCGYAGDTTFTPSGAPANWSLAVDPVKVSLASSGYGVALVSATIPTYGDSGPVTVNVNEQATSNSVPLSATVNAANEVLIVIRDGTGSDQSLHPFVQGMTVRVGTLVRIYSDDSTAGHIIHGSGIPGFTHQSIAGIGLVQGQEFDETATAPGTGELYCHSHGPVRSASAQ